MADDRAALHRLLSTVRYEVIPTGSIEERVRAAVPTSVTVTVTASPAKGLEPTLDLTERLAGAGYRSVPHISARLVADQAHLKDIVDRLVTAGVEDVFVPAGDADPPVGQYDAALPVLTLLSDLGRPFTRVGITGYPESHPAIDDDITVQAMWDKRLHATYIVSNLCFDPRAIVRWVARIRRRQVTLPVHLGVADDAALADVGGARLELRLDEGKRAPAGRAAGERGREGLGEADEGDATADHPLVREDLGDVEEPLLGRHLDRPGPGPQDRGRDCGTPHLDHHSG